MSTTGSLWGAMVKTWLEVAPCSLRVVEDVDHLPVPLDKIIAAVGCVVPDEFLRTGRRARRADGTGECAGKVRKRQRKATLVAKKRLSEAYALLMSVESAKSARPRGATYGLFSLVGLRWVGRAFGGARADTKFVLWGGKKKSDKNAQIRWARVFEA